ncbi:hypothetical protein [Azospirillum sp. sgz301742]
MDAPDDLPPLVIVPHDHVSSELSPRDRNRLRVAARTALIEAGCPPEQATVAECDKYIDALLRETAETMIKRVVDAKLAG